MPLIGFVESMAPGHKLNQMFVKEILSNKNNYSIEKLDIESSSNQYINHLTSNDYSHEVINVA